VFYFKYTDENDNEIYASITINNFDKATRTQQNALIEELKNFFHAKTLEPISKEEFDAQD